MHSFLRTGGQVLLTIPGIVALISLAYFLSVYYLDDDLDVTESNILRNTAIVATCSLLILYGRRYILEKSSTSISNTTVSENPLEAFDIKVTDKTLGIPSF